MDAHVLPPRTPAGDRWPATAAVVEDCYVVATSPRDWAAVAGFPHRAIGLHPCARPLARRRRRRAAADARAREGFVHEYAGDGAWLADLERRLVEDADLGVGECGLDKNAKAAMATQWTAFVAQWNLAARLSRRISVHCVRAHGRLLAGISECGHWPRAVYLHAWSGSTEVTQAILASAVAPKLFFGSCARHSKPEALRLVRSDRLLPESDTRLDDADRAALAEAGREMCGGDDARSRANFEAFLAM